jgi:hypothetical protein
METHLFTYRHNGIEYVASMKAASADEARERFLAASRGQYDGRLGANVHIALFPIAILVVWAKNAAASLLPRFVGHFNRR